MKQIFKKRTNLKLKHKNFNSLFCFFSLAAKHSVNPLEASPVTGFNGSLITCEI
jgi:hypothetical protein